MKVLMFMWTREEDVLVYVPYSKFVISFFLEFFFTTILTIFSNVIFMTFEFSQYCKLMIHVDVIFLCLQCSFPNYFNF